MRFSTPFLAVLSIFVIATTAAPTGTVGTRDVEERDSNDFASVNLDLENSLISSFGNSYSNFLRSQRDAAFKVFPDNVRRQLDQDLRRYNFGGFDFNQFDNRGLCIDV